MDMMAENGPKFVEILEKNALFLVLPNSLIYVLNFAKLQVTEIILKIMLN